MHGEPQADLFGPPQEQSLFRHDLRRRPGSRLRLARRIDVEVHLLLLDSCDERTYTEHGRTVAGLDPLASAAVTGRCSVVCIDR